MYVIFFFNFNDLDEHKRDLFTILYTICYSHDLPDLTIARKTTPPVAN